MVNGEPSYPEAIEALGRWLGQPSENFIWCSWGNYDRLHVLAESQKHGHTPCFMAYPHLNLKRIWRRTTGQKKKNGLAHALAFHKLDFEGRHHRGVDDARNIVRLLPFMDWSLEAELVTHPGIEQLKSSISSERMISLEAMDAATRAKAQRLNMLEKPRIPNNETARSMREPEEGQGENLKALKTCLGIRLASIDVQLRTSGHSSKSAKVKHARKTSDTK